MKTNISSRTLLLGIGAFIGLLVVVATVLALQPPQVFDPTTPEGAAQGYYQSISEGDEDRAESFMTDDLVEACEGRWNYYRGRDNHRVVITESTIDGETAILDVRITFSLDSGPFGGNIFDREETLTLERRGNRWLISEPTWPMSVFVCERGLS